MSHIEVVPEHTYYSLLDTGGVLPHTMLKAFSPEILAPIESNAKNPLLVDVARCGEQNPRLEMFKIITEATQACAHIFQNPTTEVLFSSPELLNEVVESGKISDSSRIKLAPLIEQIRSTSPTGLLTVRRAFYDQSSGQKLDGPTLNALSGTPDVINNLELMLQAAVERSYHKLPNVDIKAFVQHWEDPKTIDDFGKLLDMPRGGDVVTEKINTDGSIDLCIQAVLGDNAAITQVGEKAKIHTFRVRYYPQNHRAAHVEILHNATDTRPQLEYCYLQRKNKPTAKAKRLSTKKTNHGKDSTWWKVSIDHTNNLTTPLLNDHQLLVIGHIAGYISHKYGPKKLEFSLSQRRHEKTGKTLVAPIFNEVESWEMHEQILGVPRLLAEGNLAAIINTTSDVKKFSRKHKHSNDRNSPIILLTTQCIQNWIRDKSISELLAKLPQSCTILAPVRNTEHRVVRLRDAGHIVHPIQSYTDYPDHAYLRVMNKNGSNYVVLGDPKNKDILPPILNDHEALARGLRASREVGGKMVGTLNLAEAGFLVPSDTSFTTRTFFNEVVELNQIQHLVNSLPTANTEKALKAKFELIRKSLTNLPERTLHQIYNGLVASHGKKKKVAVRSNLSLEDRRDARFAGIFSTELNVSLKTFKNFKEKCLGVMLSYFSDDAASIIFNDLAPNTRRKLLRDFMGSLEFQPMVKKVVASGTLFGKEDGQDGRSDVIVLEAGYGTASIVDGDHSRDTLKVTYNKNQHAIESIILTTKNKDVPLKYKDLNDSPRILSGKQVNNLINLAELITKKLGSAQDVEWAITKDGHIYLLQARPI